MAELAGAKTLFNQGSGRQPMDILKRGGPHIEHHLAASVLRADSPFERRPPTREIAGTPGMFRPSIRATNAVARRRPARGLGIGDWQM